MQVTSSASLTLTSATSWCYYCCGQPMSQLQLNNNAVFAAGTGCVVTIGDPARALYSTTTSLTSYNVTSANTGNFSLAAAANLTVHGFTVTLHSWYGTDPNFPRPNQLVPHDLFASLPPAVYLQKEAKLVLASMDPISTQLFWLSPWAELQVAAGTSLTTGVSITGNQVNMRSM